MSKWFNYQKKLNQFIAMDLHWKAQFDYEFEDSAEPEVEGDQYIMYSIDLFALPKSLLTFMCIVIEEDFQVYKIKDTIYVEILAVIRNGEAVK